jgi:hypothetical protein
VEGGTALVVGLGLLGFGVFGRGLEGDGYG